MHSIYFRAIQGLARRLWQCNSFWRVPAGANPVFTLHFQKHAKNFLRLRAHTAGRLMALVFWSLRTLPSSLRQRRKTHFSIPLILSFTPV